MTPPLHALLFFALWTLLLLLIGVAPYRVGNVLLRKAAPNSFQAGVPHGPDWYQRLMRAHMNCVENLPVFGAIVLIGAVTGLSSPTFDRLAEIYVVARVCQSTAHISSGRNLAVNVRFTFFVLQVGCALWMAGLLAFR
jgi:uncharacterized MAPEG superfamily protein